MFLFNRVYERRLGSYLVLLFIFSILFIYAFVRVSYSPIKGGFGEELWVYQGSSRFESRYVVFEDLVGDLGKEAVILTWDGELAVLNGSDGSLLWSYKFESESYLMFGDLDGDGKKEVIIYGFDSLLSVFDGDGSQLWNFSVSSGVISSVYLGDVDGVDGDEVVVVVRDFGFNFSVLVFNGNGGQLWNYTKYDVVFWDVLLNDVDGDGGDEVVVVVRDFGFNFSVLVFNGDGVQLWNYTKPGKYPVPLDFSTYIHDLNGDGVSEIIVNLDVERPDYSFGDVIYVFNAANGELLWISELDNSKGDEYSLIFGNLDSDKYVDILLVDMLLDGYDVSIIYNSFNFSINLIAVSGFNGSLIWKASILEENVTEKHVSFYNYPYDFIKLPLIYDLNGDGWGDVILTGLKGKIYVLNGHNGSILWDTLEIFSLIKDFFVVDLNADYKPEIVVESLSSVGVLEGESGKSVWFFPNFIYGFDHVKFTSMGDINGDGVLDFIIGVYGDNYGEYYQKIFVLYGENGNVAWNKTYTQIDDPYFAYNFLSEAILTDLDGDNLPEVTVSIGYSFNVFDGDGTILWSYKVNKGEFYFMVLMDLDADGELEAIVVLDWWIYVFDFPRS